MRENLGHSKIAVVKYSVPFSIDAHLANSLLLDIAQWSPLPCFLLLINF